MAPATDDVIAALGALREEVERCSSCVLAETRTKAVFGEGDPGADLLFVGEAPGYHEDQQGRPFVGQAGKLLEQLLASIGMTREQVYIANVLKSRPPNNRDPRPEEIDACRPYLYRQIEIIKPRVICTLGNFATKLLTGDPRGITQVHGRPQVTEIAGHELYLFPIFHPAAALYTPSNLATLKEDFLRLPELLAHEAPQAVAEPERPAWQPPEHLRPHSPAPAVGPTLSDAAPTLHGAAIAGPTLEQAAIAALDATPMVSEPFESASAHAAPVEAAPEETAPANAHVEDAPSEAPAAAAPDEAAPASAAPVAGVGSAAPSADEALGAASEPAGVSAPDAAPPVEPEQLGLF